MGPGASSGYIRRCVYDREEKGRDGVSLPRMIFHVKCNMYWQLGVYNRFLTFCLLLLVSAQNTLFIAHDV